MGERSDNKRARDWRHPCHGWIRAYVHVAGSSAHPARGGRRGIRTAIARHADFDGSAACRPGRTGCAVALPDPFDYAHRIALSRLSAVSLPAALADRGVSGVDARPARRTADAHSLDAARQVLASTSEVVV